MAAAGGRPAVRTGEPGGAPEAAPAPLLAWLRAQGLPVGRGGAELRKFGFGQSNPTFLLQAAPGGGRRPPVRMVLRRKPYGALLPSAHAVEREYAVQKALAGKGVPVAKMIALCEDPAVFGAPFYVMDHVEGVVHSDPSMPHVPAPERRAKYLAATAALAALHALDAGALGLGDFGRKGNYCGRTLRRWGKQYRASCASVGEAPLEAMLRVEGWLGDHVPDEPRTSIVHGDFRIDNIVFDGSRALAVLDWELSTIGNPWSDLAYFCMWFHLPPAIGGPRGPAAGIPSEAEIVRAYCAAAGVPRPSPRDWAFYLALSLFRAAAILGGVGARARLGNASAADAQERGSERVLVAMCRRALALIAPLEPPRAVAAFPVSAKVRELYPALVSFMEAEVYTVEEAYHRHAESDAKWTPFAPMEALKARARAQGLWNLWLPKDTADILRSKLGPDLDQQGLLGPGLTNVEVRRRRRR